MKSSETQMVHKGAYYSYVIRKVPKKCGGTYDYECIEENKLNSSGGVEVITILRRPDGLFLVVIQNFRWAVNSWVFEFPGGLINLDESIEVAARRELEEETGFKASKVLSVQPSFYVDPWKSNDVF